MKPLLLLYATTGGNTKLVAHWVTEALAAAGLEVDLHRVEDFLGETATVAPKDAFTEYENIILASPTYGHGLLEPRAIYFYKKAKGADLTGKRVGVIGLGHDKYDDDYNVESAAILTEFAQAHGATSLCAPLKINKNPVPQLRGAVDAWTTNLIAQLKQ